MSRDDRNRPTGDRTASGDLDRLASQPQPSLLVEFVDFLKYNKKWWLVPILILLALFGLLIALAGSSAAPFIYTLF